MTNYRSDSSSPSNSSVTKRSSSLAVSSSSSETDDVNIAVRLLSSSPSSPSSSSTTSFSSISCSSNATDHEYLEEHIKFSRRLSHRSWSQQGRLWLLQSKQRLLLWKRLLVVFLSLVCTSWTLFTQLSIYQVSRLDGQNFHVLTATGPQLYRRHKHAVHQDERVLFQPIIIRIQTPPSRFVGGYQSLQQVGYSIKPQLMGYLWPSYSENNDDDDYLKEETMNSDYTIQSTVVVSMDPNNYEILKAETMDLQLSSFSKFSRRNILPINYQALFQPSVHHRRVKFDINYTQSKSISMDSTLEEEETDDKGMPWPVPEDCEPQYEWQNLSFPTCNTIHEQDMKQQLSVPTSATGNDTVQAALLAAGGYRNVWMIRNGTQILPGQVERPIAFKTLLYEREWYPLQFERHNWDALASAKLQASPYILNMYGYCGTSGMYEFAQGGNLRNAIALHGKDLTPEIKMDVAYNVMAAIADLHNWVQEGTPWIAHTDIYPDQFVKVEADRGVFKLNDFNRARLLHHKKQHRNNNTTIKTNTNNETCGFTFPQNRGKFRSPEEYAYQPETEKVDVYSAGNLLYVILTGGEYPFETRSRDTVKKILAKGKRQSIPDIYKESQNPLEQALVKAIHMCWIHDPTKRATARQVEQHLLQAIEQYKAQP